MLFQSIAMQKKKLHFPKRNIFVQRSPSYRNSTQLIHFIPQSTLPYLPLALSYLKMIQNATENNRRKIKYFFSLLRVCLRKREKIAKSRNELATFVFALEAYEFVIFEPIYPTTLSTENRSSQYLITRNKCTFDITDNGTLTTRLSK